MSQPAARLHTISVGGHVVKRARLERRFGDRPRNAPGYDGTTARTLPEAAA